MSDAGARGVEVDALGLGEGFDARVLGQVALAPVLDVVIQGVYGLARVVDLLHAQRFELVQHRGGVVVGHDQVGDQGHEIACVQFDTGGQIDGVGLSDFLDDGLSHDDLPRRDCAENGG